jgi:uncharacterized protein YunC (DUF1805 family)
MILIEKVEDSTGIRIDAGNAPLLILIANKGFIMCGYLNIEVSEKLGDTACVVRGVRSFEDVLNAKITALTSKAKEIGITEGMTGRESLKLMK